VLNLKVGKSGRDREGVIIKINGKVIARAKVDADRAPLLLAGLPEVQFFRWSVATAEDQAAALALSNRGN
jgi:hypothetical protein